MLISRKQKSRMDCSLSSQLRTIRDTPFRSGIEAVDLGLMNSGNRHGGETAVQETCIQEKDIDPK